jgi:hypothetical protein
VRLGRSLGSINVVLIVGPSDIDAPHEALEGSFVCTVEVPVGKLVIGAARFGDPAQAVQMVDWLRGATICRPGPARPSARGCCSPAGRLSSRKIPPIWKRP